MENLPKVFVDFATLLRDKGINAYLIGSSSRDLLLGNEIKDFDITVDAPIDEVIPLFDHVHDKFKKYGSVVIKYEGISLDVTSFRKEDSYKDHRHPDEIVFTKNMSEDFKRRDFTINALYISLDGEIFDFSCGINDLANHLIRMIGIPSVRLKEDPLRILRAIRFSLVYDFEIEESLQFAILKHGALLNKISPFKIESELDKMRKANVNEMDIKKEFKKFNLMQYYTKKGEKNDK